MAEERPELQTWSEKTGYKIAWLEDIPYPPFFAKNRDAYFEFLQKMKLRSGDMTICTYPKCGTTWMQQILLLLAMKDTSLVTDPMDQSPWPICNIKTPVDDWIASLNSGEYRRVWKAHAPHQLFKMSQLDTVEWEGAKGIGHKTVIVSRGPFDAAVSMYHHALDVPGFEFTGEWNDFFELFIDGKVEFGCYFTWHRKWWEEYQKNQKDILWVTFEDLKKDLKGQIRRIATFFEFEVTEELIDLVYSGSTFEAMKAQAEKTNEEKLKKGLFIKKNHIRKGKVGGWHGYFSEEQIERFNKKIAEAPCPWIDFTTISE